jgi:hypothetical protein
VKKLIGLGVLLLVACQRKVEVSSPTPTPATNAVGTVGGSTPLEALAAFMTAAKAEDLQAVAAVWGDHEGLARDKMSRQELEMRTYIIVKCVRHDSYKVVSDGAAASGRRVMNVQVTKAAGPPRGTLNVSSTFTMARGPQGRWFVEIVEMKPLETTICQLP